MGIVYRMCEGLLIRLPMDDCGRRVFTETLADWRREASAVRGLVAVSRALVQVSVAEVSTFAMAAVVMRAFAWLTLALFVSFSIWNGQSIPPAAVLYSLVGCAAFFLPAALLCASSGRGKAQVPTLGLAVAGSLVSVTLMLWAMPAGNQAMFDANPPSRVTSEHTQPAAPTGFVAFARATWPQPPIEFLSPARLPQLASQILYSPWGGWGAIQHLSFRLSFVMLCLLVPFAAAGLRNINSRISRWVALSIAVATWLYASPLAAFVEPDWIFWPFVSYWIPVVPAVALAAMGPRAKASASTP